MFFDNPLPMLRIMKKGEKMKRIIKKIITEIDEVMGVILGFCIICLSIALFVLLIFGFVLALMALCTYPQYFSLTFALIMVIYAIVKYAIIKPYLRSRNSNKKAKFNQKEWLLLAVLIPILAYLAFRSLKYTLVTIFFELAGFLGSYLAENISKGGEK